jgi:hypothetical protein
MNPSQVCVTGLVRQVPAGRNALANHYPAMPLPQHGKNSRLQVVLLLPGGL